MRLRSAKQRANAAWKLLATAVGIPDLPLAIWRERSTARRRTTSGSRSSARC